MIQEQVRCLQDHPHTARDQVCIIWCLTGVQTRLKYLTLTSIDRLSIIRWLFQILYFYIIFHNIHSPCILDIVEDP